MKTIVKQIKNLDLTFTYLVNNQVHVQNSKKDYKFFLDEVGMYSNSINSITSQQKFWLKNGNDSINKDNLNIIEIQKY
jgi:type III secretory pathway component EscR